MKTHLQKHIGSYARGFLYAVISGLSVWSTAIGDKSGPELYETLEQRWPALLLLSLVAIATTIRAQLDGHIGRASQQPPTPPTS